MNNRIGVVSCHLASIEPLNDTFARLSALGIQEIEWFWCTDFATRYGADVFQRIRELHKRYAMHASYHAPWTDQWDLGLAPAPQAHQMLMASIHMAEQLGAADITIHMGTCAPAGHSAVSRTGVLHHVSEVLLNTAHEATARKMRLCVENVPRSYSPLALGTDSSDFARFFAHVPSHSVGLNLDTGHGHIMGELYDYIHHHSARLMHVHMHDNDGKTDAHLPPGEGSIDWGRFLSALRIACYTGPIVLEFPEASGKYPDVIRLIRDA